MNEELKSKVDRLGLLQATVADLKKQIEQIEADLTASNEKVVEGSLYRATIEFVEPTSKVDWKAVAAKLQPTPQLVAAHTKIALPYYRVKCKARQITKASPLKAAVAA